MSDKLQMISGVSPSHTHEMNDPRTPCSLRAARTQTVHVKCRCYSGPERLFPESGSLRPGNPAVAMATDTAAGALGRPLRKGRAGHGESGLNSRGQVWALAPSPRNPDGPLQGRHLLPGLQMTGWRPVACPRSLRVSGAGLLAELPPPGILGRWCHSSVPCWPHEYAEHVSPRAMAVVT